MALQIPAWDDTGMGKQGMDAGLGLGRIKNEFCFAIFLQDGVIAVYGDLSEGLGAVAKYDGVNSIGEQCSADHSRDPDEDHPTQQTLEPGFQGWTHSRAIIRSGIRGRMAGELRLTDSRGRPSPGEFLFTLPFGRAR